ncbi:MAG TPA: GNAT family N-acetyltransferase [Thermoplasmata archaeon]|nr:GNAT family N-acetyltransferase [Thermoplasmata archaeon]
MFPDVEPLLREEREFVHALGGHSVAFHGGTLVVHERLPFPRFNFIQELDVRRDRASAFFERALDYYFQRALRPSIRVAEPVPAPTAGFLQQFGFRPRREPLVLLRSSGPVAPARTDGHPTVRRAEAEELDTLVRMLAEPAESEELRRLIEAAWSRPGSAEEFVPLVAERDGAIAATAIVHRFHEIAGIHGVATVPPARGKGAATALVEFAVRAPAVRSATVWWLPTEHPALATHLQELGFTPLTQYRVHDLPPGAELALPAARTSGPPLWRPPRPPSKE